MKKALKIIGNTLLYLLIALAIYIFVSAVVSIFRGKIPSVFGYNIFIVETGSMEPTIHVKDIIFSKIVDISTIKEGDIITFTCIDSTQAIAGQTITHRAVSVEEINGVITIITQGDANSVADTYKVTADNFIGLVTGKSTFLGNIIYAMSKGMFFIILAVVLVMCGLFGYKIYLTYKKEAAEEKEKDRIEDLKKELLEEIKEEITNGKKK